MLYKYISEVPVRVNDIPVIRVGDTIDISSGDTIKNLTSGDSIVLESLESGQTIMYILQNSVKIDDNIDETDDLYLVKARCDKRTISTELYNKLDSIGILDHEVRGSNVGASDYSKHLIQPWSIWKDYNLNPWDADIVKRVLRTKKESGKNEIESRIMDYDKIIHICKERIRQLECDKDE